MRFRSVHAGPCRRSDRTATVRRLQDMVENLKSTSMQSSMRSEIANLQTIVKEIGLAFTLLEVSDTAAVIAGERDELLIKLLQLLDNLPSAEVLTHMLTFHALPKDKRFQGHKDIVCSITKLRKYRASCRYLTKAACTTAIFRSITIAEVWIQKSPSTKSKPPSLTTCLERMDLAWKPEMSNRLKTKFPDLSKQFQNEIANLNPKIHAEIQLVFFYEQHNSLQRPRIICSSKSACFLCNLFIRLHGKFLIRKTHGVLYPKWTLPANDKVSLCDEAKQTINHLFDQFQIEIRGEIRKNMRGAVPKRLHPTESLFSLQAWSDSNKSIIDRSSASIENTAGNTSDTIGRGLIPTDQLLKGDETGAGTDKPSGICSAKPYLALQAHDNTGMKQQQLNLRSTDVSCSIR